MRRSGLASAIARPVSIAGLALACTAAPVTAQGSRTSRITIAIEPRKGIAPEQARAPALLLDDQGQLIVVDQVRGFILGRFAPPAGLGTGPASGAAGIELGADAMAGPPLPPIPLTPLKPQVGFPFMADGALAGSPCVADLDQDGRCEIALATTEGTVYLLRDDGRTAEGWPRHESDGFYASPAAGDLDGNGTLEIVLGGISGRVYAWSPDGTPVPGWPVRLSAPESAPSRDLLGAVEFQASASLADMEADGADEVCIAAAQGAVWLLDGTGRVLPGWPQSVPAASDPPNPGSVFASPGLADLDGDRLPEVVVAGNAYAVHAWFADGRPVPGWPAPVTNRARAGYGGVALGDLDADGHTEVVVTSEHGFAGPAAVSVLGHDGVSELGWPYLLPEPCNAGAALGDLNGDLLPEVVVATIGGNAAVVVLEGVTGQPLPGWPVRLKGETVNASPIITDIDGDGRNDVVVAALSTGSESDAWIWALDAGGRQLAGFPIMLPHDEIVRAAPVAADLDGDGDLELLAATERLNTLYVWDLEALCDPSTMPWPGAAGSASRCACLETVEPPVGDVFPAGSVAGTSTAPIELSGGLDLSLAPGAAMGSAADATGSGSAIPAGAQSRVQFALASSGRVRLLILNVTGTVVRRLLDHQLPPGEYTIFWDGKDDRGRPQTSGIYHVRLWISGSARTQQLLLLK